MADGAGGDASRNNSNASSLPGMPLADGQQGAAPSHADAGADAAGADAGAEAMLRGDDGAQPIDELLDHVNANNGAGVGGEAGADGAGGDDAANDMRAVDPVETPSFIEAQAIEPSEPVIAMDGDEDFEDMDELEAEQDLEAGAGAGAGAGTNVIPITFKDLNRAKSKAKLTKTLSDRLLELEELNNKSFREPNLEKAKKHLRDQIYKNGRAPLCARKKDIAPLGLGINLYLGFLRQLMCLMLIMGVLSFPVIFLSISGSKISVDQMDPLGLGVTTLGNNGPALTAIDRQNGSTSISAADTVVTDTIVFGNTIKSRDISRLLTASEFITGLVFLLFIAFFKYSISRAMNDGDSHLSAMAYTVYVKGLPHDATAFEIRNFFSDLYDLSKESWTFRGWSCCKIRSRKRGHEPIPGRKPVSDVSNTGDVTYMASWVSEVSIAYQNGRTIRSYAKLRKILTKLQEAKFTVQRFNPKSEHANDKKHAKATKKAAMLEKKLEKLQSLHKLQAVESNKVVGAFVTFNHMESAQRCLADYKGSKSGFWRKFQPKPLRFGANHEYPLVVRPAPEPTNVLWENIETPASNRFWRRTLTTFIMFVLLLLSFILIIVAQRAKRDFTSQSPSLTACDTELPAMSYGTYDFPEKATLGRGNATQDASCPDGKFWLQWVDADNEAAGAVAPIPGAPCTENCQSPSESGFCSQLDGKTIQKSTVVACYCIDILKQAITDHGVFQGPVKAQESDGDLCTDAAANFLAAQSMFIVAAMSVVVINVALQRVLKGLSRFERHDTVSLESSAVAFKIFLAQLLNTGFIVLLVHGKLPNVDQTKNPVQPIGIFDGDFDGFVPAWYATVGVSIILTMILQVFVPHVMPLTKALCLRPCMRCCLRRGKASQSALNRLYAPQHWDLAQRYPYVLNSIFVTLMYSGGLPILLPIAFLSYLMFYWVDRLLILRYAANPPNYDTALAQRALSLLPIAFVLHVCMTAWMFGNNEVLQSDIINGGFLGSDGDIEAEYEKWRLDQEASWDTLGITTKLVRENVFPLAFLLIMFLVMWVIIRLALKAFLGCLVSTFHLLTCGKCHRMEAIVIKEVANDLDVSLNSGGYTDEYHEPLSISGIEVSGTPEEQEAQLRHKLRKHLKSHEREEGWTLEIIRDSAGNIAGATKQLLWKEEGTSAQGLHHEKDQPMRVWEVIHHHGNLHSYHVMANEKYRRAVLSMRQAQMKVNRRRSAIEEEVRAKDLAMAKYNESLRFRKESAERQAAVINAQRMLQNNYARLQMQAQQFQLQHQQRMGMIQMQTSNGLARMQHHRRPAHEIAEFQMQQQQAMENEQATFQSTMQRISQELQSTEEQLHSITTGAMIQQQQEAARHQAMQQQLSPIPAGNEGAPDAPVAEHQHHHQHQHQYQQQQTATPPMAAPVAMPVNLTPQQQLAQHAQQYR